MADMTPEDSQKFGLTDSNAEAVLTSPTEADVYYLLSLSVDRMSLSKDNANPGVSPVEPVNARFLLTDSVSLSDIQKMDALAVRLGLTQSELLRRWTKVLLYFLGYIENPAPID